MTRRIRGRGTRDGWVSLAAAVDTEEGASWPRYRPGKTPIGAPPVEQIPVSGSGPRTGDREPTALLPGWVPKTWRKWRRRWAGSAWDLGWLRLPCRDRWPT